METILLVILKLSGLLYLIKVLDYIINWSALLKQKRVLINDNSITISIIIAARNEENTITNLLNDLIKQTYPSDKYEIIIIDDFSDDDTYNVVNNFIIDNGSHAFQLIKQKKEDNNTFGKKKAINLGISLAKGTLIVQTDADCRVGEEWLSTIVNNYSNSDAKMMFGLVAYNNDTTIFKKLQHLEFLSLIVSGAAAAFTKPIMCNGANLIYEKKAYEEAKSLSKSDKYASGDDVFLMLSFKKLFGNKSIKVITDKEAIVYTEAKETLKEFINQRIRWASKAKGYKDFDIILTALIVLLFNLSLVLTFILSFIYNALFFPFILFFILKLLIDFPLLYKITKYINRKDLLIYYIPLQILYIPYLCFTAIAGFIFKYKWKDRVVRD